MQTSSDTQQLLHAIMRQHDRRSLAKALTHLDNNSKVGKELKERLIVPETNVPIIGITGAPGSGKSTLLNALLKEFLKNGNNVGILAVDPSSPYTGGALLGDRVRMLEWTQSKNVFIRSLSSRGSVGGLSNAVYHMLNLYQIFGFDVIFVETVGAGQSEIEIMKFCDLVVLITSPNSGDGIQVLKAGIMEIADIYVVSKSDLPHAKLTTESIKKFLSLIPSINETKPVITTSTVNNTGIQELYTNLSQSIIQFNQNSDNRNKSRLKEYVISELLTRFEYSITRSESLEKQVEEVLGGKLLLKDLFQNFLR